MSHTASADDASAVPHDALIARVAAAPYLDKDHERVQLFDFWVEDLPKEQRQEFTKLVNAYPKALPFLRGISQGSPYLLDLMRMDASRVVRVLRNTPETHLERLIASVRHALEHAGHESEAMTALRAFKNEAALLIALCDIAAVWPVMKVTQALTDIADAGVQAALRFLLLQEVRRERMKPANPSQPEIGCGLFVLAMGKMGAGELNFSSDIDLILFFDRDTHVLATDVEAQPFFVRIGQGLSRLMQQRTGDGYVFRVDYRLRPDPGSTPVAIATDAALDYYEREGRTWERAAMIKARPCAGDIESGERFLRELTPFVWRKHLDFAALADVHDMKRQMHAYKGHNEIAIEGHNIKLGRGGIREIEFFVQTQQLIAGGRAPYLRARQTLMTLDRLYERKWIEAEAHDDLNDAYVYLRRVEHRIQMIADEQTHALPESTQGVDALAKFLGYEDRDAFARDLATHLGCVQKHYANLFESHAEPAGVLKQLNFDNGPDDTRLLDGLVEAGFRQPRMVATTISTWLSGEYRALKSSQAQELLRTFLPTLVTFLARGESPDSAIITFDRFLQELRGAIRLFQLLKQNPDLVSLLALVLGASPRLGDMLARRPQLLDGLVDPRFFGAMPARDEIAERLALSLQDAHSYEEFLDRLRMFGQESLFLIGSRILSGTVTAQQAGEAFANVAEGIVRVVHRRIEEIFAERHGRMQGQETAIIALGRLGSSEMTATSDLDLICIYDFDKEHLDSDGEKSLHGAEYFARLTHRLIGAFTTRTNYGALYDVDMRLRPSGRAGPVATHIDAFKDYQHQEAWTWEHMALTRARVVSASPEFKDRIDTIIRDVLCTPRDSNVVARDVRDMREALAAEKGSGDVWDLKHNSGGMIDLDFIAQYIQLVHAAQVPDILQVNTLKVFLVAQELGFLSQGDSEVLRAAGRLYHDLMQIFRLCLSDKFDPARAGHDLLRRLALAGGVPDFATLEALLRDRQMEVHAIFNRILKVDI